MYGSRDIRKADEANELNRKINHVAKDKCIRIVKDNWIRNVPITIGDIRQSYAQIFILSTVSKCFILCQGG